MRPPFKGPSGLSLENCVKFIRRSKGRHDEQCGIYKIGHYNEAAFQRAVRIVFERQCEIYKSVESTRLAIAVFLALIGWLI